MPVSKTNCTPNPSKDLKTYKRPLQTITDYFGPSRLNVKPPVKLNDNSEFRDCTKQTLLLQKSPLDSSPNNSGVFQVTASNTIDVKTCGHTSYLSDELRCFLRPSNPEELGLEKGSNYVGKRKTPQSTHSSAAKKTKSDMVELQEQADKQQSSVNTEFSFEFSEGEEEESFIPANKDTESSTVYSCKHCDYTDANIDNVSAHYQNDHPYVRYNSVYIQDPSDESAIFRCLICPVEFLTVPDLKRHCTKDHPECPNLLMMQSSDLVFKCFVCAFTTDVSEELITHYKGKHPKHEVDSYFMYCRYSMMKHNEEPSQLNNSVKAPRSEMPQQFSAMRDHTSRKDENVSSNQQPTSDGARTTIYHCNSCNFSDPSAVGVRVHYQKSHPDEVITLNKIKLSAQATSHSTQPLIDGGSPESAMIKEKSSPQTDHGPDPYECPDKLFYCQICNYANIIVQGVVNHQTKSHSRIETSLEHVIKYTAMIHDGMKAQAEDSSFTCRLPLPIIQAGKEDVFFCHLCNFRSSKVSRVLQHYSTKHQAVKVSRDQVEQYTSSILRQIKDSCLQKTAGKDVSQALLGKKETTRKNTMKLTNVSACPPKKRKLQSKQPEDCSDTDGADGGSPSPRCKQSESKTYSCRACSFKGGSISGIAQHYRAVHPWSVKEDGSVLHLIKNNKSKMRKQQEDENEMPASFESYQVPLEFEKSPEEVASPKRIKCPFCPAVFPSQHGLSDHCVAMHQDGAVQNVDAQKEEQMKIHSRLHVFKCPYCYYVNVSHLGVLTHCHMKHVGLVARAESCRLQTTRAPNFENCVKRKGSFLRHCGYMCKNCPQIYVTMNGLRKHCKKIHCEPLASMVPKESKSAPKHSALAKRKLQKINNNQGSISKASFLNKQVFWCQYCSYGTNTKHLLTRHLQVCHKTESGATAQDCLYKCVLCPAAYSKRRQLKKHCSKKHRKKALLQYDTSDEELDERAALTVPGSSVSQHTLEACNSSMTKEENTISVYKCPSCPYVNITYHGTFIHCKMKHPDVAATENELQKDEVLVAQLAGRSLSGDSNTGGYKCEKCPQILKSREKLKLHCERKHNEAQATASRRAGEVDTNKDVGQDFQESVSQSSCLKIKTPALDTSANGLKHPLGSVKTFPLSPLQGKKLLYKCCICLYRGSCRKYLYYHYKNAHKFDALTRCKLLQKYNKRKGPEAREKAEPAEISHLECKMCPDMKFESTQQLISHYSTFHLSGRILDFIVLNIPSKKSTGLYKCSLCNKKMNGIKKLCHHLDHHRESERKAKSVRTVALDIIGAAPQTTSIADCWQDELPVLETVEDLAKWNVTPAETFSVPPSPSSSPPSIPPNLEKAELASKEDKLTCKQCGRIFHSLKGLVSHERGHAALAAIKKQTTLSTSTFKHDLNKYVLYKAGNRLPFLCTLCPYRTTVLSLWRSHFMKKHRSVTKDFAKTDNEESVHSAQKELPNSAEKPSTPPEHNEDVQMTEESFYSEAPDVQRQLNHFNSIAQTSDPSKTNAQEATSHDSSLLYCELCTFNTGHLSSMRRHYSNRHGKKMLTCKNCTFVTCSKKTLEMHNNMGHDSSCQSAATHQGNIHCPFCLYKTKNKNYMIDHIVLHREQRVVPIEASRPKLSRYLQGIVFRCHKCTFTSGSEENLRVHMTKHDGIRPYKCLLCYFDCTQLSDLEAHLSDKHQVLRNHELVGQIHLDELGARVGRMPEEQEQPTSDIDCGTDCNGVSHQTQTEDLAENETKENACLNQNSADFKKQEDDHQERAETAFFSGTGRGHRRESTPELTAGDRKHLTSQNEEQVQAKPGDADGNGVIMPKLKEPLKHRRVSIESIEDDILRNVLLLEKGGSTVKMRRKSELDVPFAAELAVEPVVTDSSQKECLLVDNQANSQNIHNGTDEVSASAKTNPAQPVQIRTLGRFTFERHLLTLGPYNGQHKLSIKGVSFANREETQMKNPIKIEKVEDPCAENQYLKEEMHLVSICKEEDGGVDCEQKEDRRDETTHQSDKNLRHEKGGRTEDTQSPCVSKGPLTGMDGETTEESKAFSCEFCGRKLTNSAQLERHVVRHGK